MYAILQHGGHQHRVSAGDRMLVDRLSDEVGSVVSLRPVLLLGGGEAPEVDRAGDASVSATVVAHLRGKKIRVFKYKAKKRYRRTMGHRSDLTELRVEAVVVGGKSDPAAVPERTTSAVDAAPQLAPGGPGHGS